MDICTSVQLLPPELINLIQEYLPKKEFVFTNRENYKLYHSEIHISRQNYDSFIKTGGYGNKPYEKNYFPNAKMFNTKEENILMSLAHGLYINNAKHLNQRKYMTCYPIEKTFCLPDPKTSMSLTQMPAFIFYNELFMMREGQKDLKLNFITKMPTSILTEIKTLYEKYIGDCYKKTLANTQHQGKKNHKRKSVGKNHKKQHRHKKQHYKSKY